MANRQTAIVGAIGIFAGMVIGASSAQNALLVGFSGSNPNANQGIVRVGNILRNRSDMPYAYYVTPRAIPFTEGYIGNVRDARLAEYNMYGSAPTQTIRGVPAVELDSVMRCAGLSRGRFTQCLSDPNYLPNDWEYLDNQN